MTRNGKETAAVFDRMLGQAPVWAVEPGPFSPVILSSRVRLARNLSAIPFPALTTEADQSTVVNRLRRVAGEVEELAASTFVPFDGLDEREIEFLVERRLISKDLARGRRRRGVLVGEGEGEAIMVNEEDHFRLQAVVSGLRLGEALDRGGLLDRVLDARLDYAFHDKYGFLTACPTNVGTGMRASVLAHLPALVLTRRAKKVIQGVTAMGLAVRGFYGEGSDVMGNFFQISNQTTLGPDEHAIVSRLDEVVRQIIGFEEEARETMWKQARPELEDKIYRGYATLRYARTISWEEVASLASAVRFGIALELPGLVGLATLNEILVFSQPGHVTRRAGRELSDPERRELRAEYVRARVAADRGGEPSRPGRGIADHPEPGLDE